MTVTIRRIGNSLGIIIPKDILDRHGLKEGDEVGIQDEAGGILITARDEDFNRQVNIAQKFMDKYKVTLQKLAE